jgi:sugar phosphate isomerase/epimerase
MKLLLPVVEYAKAKGIKICIENMPSEREAPDNHLYGSCALNISALAEKLGACICWDVGHANISGYKQSEQMEILKGKLDVLHIHDNDGVKDKHLLPFDGSVDWDDVARGMRCCDFAGILDVEVTAWALDGSREVRDAFGNEIKFRAKQLLAKLT